MYIYLCILYIYYVDDWFVYLFYLYMFEGVRFCNLVVLKSEIYILVVVVFILFNVLLFCDIKLL